jgi:hypothetical protein
MGKINWSRVFVCGLLVGVVMIFAGAGIFALWGKDLAGGRLPLDRPFALLHSGWPVVFIIGINLALGITVIWLYAAIRPRYGAGPKTAAATGFVVWLILCMDDLFFVAMGMFPAGAMLAPLAGALLAIVVATELGAWLYRE